MGKGKHAYPRRLGNIGGFFGADVLVFYVLKDFGAVGHSRLLRAAG